LLLDIELEDLWRRWPVDRVVGFVMVICSLTSAVGLTTAFTGDVACGYVSNEFVENGAGEGDEELGTIACCTSKSSKVVERDKSCFMAPENSGDDMSLLLGRSKGLLCAMKRGSLKNASLSKSKGVDWGDDKADEFVSCGLESEVLLEPSKPGKLAILG
jgi:hypothetical protein